MTDKPDKAPPEEQPTRRPVSVLAGPMLLLVSSALALGVLLLSGNLLAIMLIFVTVGTIRGYRHGGFKLAASLVGMVVAYLLAAPLGRRLQGFWGAAFGLPELEARLASLVMTAVLLAAAVAAGVLVLEKVVRSRLTIPKRTNRVAGVVIGVGEGVLLGAALCWLAVAVAPLLQERAPESRITRSLVNTATQARQSTLGRMLQSFNPVRELRLAGLMGQLVPILKHPEARDEFLHHPQIEKLKRDPEVARVIEKIREAQQLKEAADDQSTEQLKRSPVLLEVLDNDVFLDRVEKSMPEIREAMEHARKFLPEPPGAKPTEDQPPAP